MERRIFSIDCTRGLMALAVVIYHNALLAFWTPQSEDVLGRVGVYAVAIFYIISGLTLYILYHQANSFRELKVYSIKRFFRIYPLLCVASVLWLLVMPDQYNGRALLLNFTGLFGFIDPGAYVGRVAWSIGNELVFYALFPVFILAIGWNSKTW